MGSFLNKFKNKSILKFLLGSGLSYSFFKFTSNPSSNLHKKIPKERFKNIDLLPNLEIERKTKAYHLHHWLYLSVLYGLFILRKKKMPQSKLLNGLFIGGILQGLTYKDRFKIVEKKPEAIEETNAVA